MIRPGHLLSLFLLAVSTPVLAQTMPWPDSDTRIRSVEYRNDQVVPIRAAPGYQVTIELASDERVQSIALGDSGAWQVSANKAGNLLFVKPVQAGMTTNLTVVTDVRRYDFDLTAVAEAGGDLPYAIRFSYPTPTAIGLPGMPPGLQSGAMVGDYRLHGEQSLFPTAISDDGSRTFIDWPSDGPLPAVYSRDDDGRETLVNGNMRGRFFVIDSVSRHLVFRIDRRRARADRTAAGDRK